jgi:hypothetical protein
MSQSAARRRWRRPPRRPGGGDGDGVVGSSRVGRLVRHRAGSIAPPLATAMIFAARSISRGRLEGSRINRVKAATKASRRA